MTKTTSLTTPPFEVRSQAYWDSLETVKKGTFVKFSQDIHEGMVLKASKLPMSMDGIAATLGVPTIEFYDWVSKGKGGQEPYRTWLCDLVVARGQQEAKLVQRLLDSPDWKSSAVLLRSIRPDVYDDKRPAVSLSDSTLDTSRLSASELETLTHLLSKMGNRVDAGTLALPPKKKK